MRRTMHVALAAALLVGSGCGTDSSSGTDAYSSEYPADSTVEEPTYSAAYMLATIHGDPSSEAEFQRILDCVQASGIEGGETEEQIGDTLVAGWEVSGQAESLLAFSQALC